MKIVTAILAAGMIGTSVPAYGQCAGWDWRCQHREDHQRHMDWANRQHERHMDMMQQHNAAGAVVIGGIIGAMANAARQAQIEQSVADYEADFKARGGSIIKLRNASLGEYAILASLQPNVRVNACHTFANQPEYGATIHACIKYGLLTYTSPRRSAANRSRSMSDGGSWQDKVFEDE